MQLCMEEVRAQREGEAEMVDGGKRHGWGKEARVGERDTGHARRTVATASGTAGHFVDTAQASLELLSQLPGFWQLV
jgi:hypothetical protein